MIMLLGSSTTDVVNGGMSTRAHVTIAFITLLGLAFVFRLVRRSQLKSKYTVLWLGASTVIVLMVLFPSLLTHLSRLLGIYYPPATFLAIAVGVLFLIVVHYSWELSRSEERVRVLAEEVGLMQQRVTLLEAALADDILEPGDNDPEVSQ